MGMALDATPPEWLEDMGPGDSITSAQYGTLRAVVEEDAFTPEELNSKLTLTAGDLTFDIDQTVATSIDGTPEGVTRQLLKQNALASVQKWPSLGIDAEVDDAATTLVMNMKKDQSAWFSGKMVSTIAEELVKGYDAPFDGIGIPPAGNDQPNPNGVGQYIGFDDQYGGGHQLAWLDLTGNPAAWTATFNDEGSLTTTDANGKSVSLKQSLVDATVTVSAEARDPDVKATNLISIIDPGCSGFGDLWTLNPNGVTTFVGKGDLVASDYDGSAQLTEAAASVSSDVTLTDHEVQLLGSVYDIRTMDGSFGLDGAFADAVLTEDSIINVDLDGDMDFSWT
jgi:hypothetical protein